MSPGRDWIARASEAASSQGDPQLRALVILEAARHISRAQLTSEQGTALLELELIASRVAGIRDDGWPPTDAPAQLAAAWAAFEAHWYGDPEPGETQT